MLTHHLVASPPPASQPGRLKTPRSPGPWDRTRIDEIYAVGVTGAAQGPMVVWVGVNSKLNDNLELHFHCFSM